MRVVIVCSFDTYEARVDMIYEYFKDRGDDVSVIVSDFCHVHKDYRKIEKKDYIPVHAKEYRKNLSIARMKSHHYFAKEAFDKVKDLKPELLYVLFPANSLVKQAALYKRTNKDTKLIFDVIDLWPETMTIGKLKKVFPFTSWRNLRDKYIDEADYVITECNLFRDKLKDAVSEKKIETLYFSANKLSDEIVMDKDLPSDSISLCYLGSINNIIDIDFIVTIINAMKEKVKLHIIGDGEKKEEFLNKLKKTNAEVIYHGKIYDDEKKAQILAKCHYGLNIMKPTVCVGLTMKSVDYFRFGLPIINNIYGDTWDIVENRGVGINVNADTLQELYIDRNIDRHIITECFDDLLAQEQFFDKMTEIMKII